MSVSGGNILGYLVQSSTPTYSQRGRSTSTRVTFSFAGLIITTHTVGTQLQYISICHNNLLISTLRAQLQYVSVMATLLCYCIQDIILCIILYLTYLEDSYALFIFLSLFHDNSVYLLVFLDWPIHGEHDWLCSDGHSRQWQQPGWRCGGGGWWWRTISSEHHLPLCLPHHVRTERSLHGPHLRCRFWLLQEHLLRGELFSILSARLPLVNCTSMMVTNDNHSESNSRDMALPPTGDIIAVRMVSI